MRRVRLAPSLGSARLEHIDALRGFALFLILVINARIFSLFVFLDPDVRQILPTVHWDGVIDPILTFLVEHKAIGLFTLLFGISFTLQYQRTTAAEAAADGQFVRFYARRLLVLFVIGLLHSFFWSGDVLRWYAVMGSFLLASIRMRLSVTACLGILLAVVPWSAFSSASFASASPPVDQMLNSTFVAFSQSNFFTMVKANFAYEWWFRRIDWAFPIALCGRFLIGVAIGRSQPLQAPEEFRRFWISVASLALPCGLALSGIGSYAADAMPEPLARTLRSGASLLTALGYMAAFILIFQVGTFRRWLRPLVAVGRMTLTNYLLQTFAGIVVFYGIGFGIGPRFGLVGAMAFAIALFAIQIAFSQWWLTRFAQGPVEWMWRCLTYGAVIPLRKA